MKIHAVILLVVSSAVVMHYAVSITGKTVAVGNFNWLTLSNPMSDLVRHYDFPVPDTFLDL
jgi:hypothetical protein